MGVAHHQKFPYFCIMINMMPPGRFVTLALAFVFLAGCKDESLVSSPSKPIDYASIGTISYSKHVQPIFDQSCNSSGCHNAAFGAGGLLLDSWQHLLLGSPAGAQVVSGNTFMSHMMQHINKDTTLSPVSSPSMPLGRDDLPDETVRFIARWIDEGAKNDDGALPFASRPAGMMLATNQSSDLIAVVDVASNLVMRYVKVGSQVSGTTLGAPHHVRADLHGAFFYVTMIQTQELWKFSASDFTFIAKMPVPPFPADVILTPGGDTAFVTNFSTVPQAAVMIDTRTMQILKTYTVPSALRPFISFSHGALLSRDGKYFYTINQGSGNMLRIELATDAMDIVALDTAGALTSAIQPYLADESPDGRYLYVSGYGTNDVRIVDTQSDPLRAALAVPVGGTNPSRPLHVHVSPDGQYLVSANQGSDDVTIIRTSDFTREANIANVGRQPHGLQFTPDGAYLYVSCENRVEAVPPHHPTTGSKGISFITVIDFAQRRIIRKIEVGGFAAGLSFSPNTGTGGL
jgi:YVTN family beta-propeller protein